MNKSMKTIHVHIFQGGHFIVQTTIHILKLPDDPLTMSTAGRCKSHLSETHLNILSDFIAANP